MQDRSIQSHTMSFVIICGILWHPVCTYFSVIQLVPDTSVHCPVNVYLSGEVSSWTCLCHASSLLGMLGAQVTTCQRLSCHWWKPCTVCHGITHTPYTFTNWQWISLVQHTQHTTIKTHFILEKSAMVLQDHPSLIRRYPLIAVQWRNLHVPITCLNLQFHDTISCQTSCYLIFLNLVYMSEVDNSKYTTRNTSKKGSTTGMNKDVPLILNNNHAVGVTDKVREITCSISKDKSMHTL